MMTTLAAGETLACSPASAFLASVLLVPLLLVPAFVVPVLLAFLMIGAAQPAGAQTAAGAEPANEITLEVSMRGVSAPAVAPGSVITWDYSVANTGTTDWTRLIVDDGTAGRVCLIPVLVAGASARCSLRTTAGPSDYETTATVSGTPSPRGPLAALASASRSYRVASEIPSDLAYVDVPRPAGQAAPAWPVDRWGPYAIAGALGAVVVSVTSKRLPARNRAGNRKSTRSSHQR